MSNKAIKVENLGKSYQLGELDQFYDMRDAITDLVKFPYRYFSNNGSKKKKKNNDNQIWALKNINFEVSHGEIVGIIGRNGAGKSTLLKILSRITSPSEGEVTLNGRVGSLLEVGTGFHPELTGRENIFLNGSILGMSKKEIERKFNEIIDFAEVEKFLDTPVKRYSSGMYVRLAFAVAAHLEPEILLVDEVLAVGDVGFQKKCLGKMDDVAKEGRTILFVSHNLGTIRSLCDRTIFISDGKIETDDLTENSINSYLENINNAKTKLISERDDRKGKGNIKLVNLYLESMDGTELNHLQTGDEVNFVFTVNKIVTNMALSFTIYNNFGQPVTSFHNNIVTNKLSEGYVDNKIVCKIDKILLLHGQYYLNVALTVNDVLEDHLEGAYKLTVNPGFENSKIISGNGKYGNIYIPHKWL